MGYTAPARAKPARLHNSHRSSLNGPGHIRIDEPEFVVQLKDGEPGCVLRNAGVLKGASNAPVTPTLWVDMPDGNCFSFAEEAGLIEQLVDMGESVGAGQVVARIRPIGKTGAIPSDVCSKMDGILCARHFPGLGKSGDCVAVVAVAEQFV